MNRLKNACLRFAVAVALSSTVHATEVAAGQPAECGDIDGNGSVVAADALMVLRKAVGLPMEYQCVVMETTTSTSTSSTIHVDECFDDSDCQGNPDGPHCCAYECAECDKNEDCGEGQYCSTGCECLPMP
jgi:hypothetical protein